MTTLARALALLLALLGVHSAARPAHSLAGIRAISIKSAAGSRAEVTDPAQVRAIVGWFDALPPFQASWCPVSAYAPPTVTFVFRGPGATRTTAVDRSPGTCPGEISVDGTTLADDGFVTRVSQLLAIDFAPNARTAKNQALANKDVRRLLGLVRVPAGSRPYTKPRRRPRRGGKPKIKIIRTPEFGTVHYVRLHRTWTVDMPLAAVVAFEKGHQPGASSDGGTGYGARGSVVTDRELTFSFRPVAGRIAARALDFELDRVTANRTRIHVEAWENWVVVGAPKKHVPGGVRVIVIHRSGRLVGRITEPKRIARVVRWFDALPVSPPYFGFGCYFAKSSPVRIDFVGAGGRELATASGSTPYSSYCYPITFSVEGLKYPSLNGGNVLLRIERLAR